MPSVSISEKIKFIERVFGPGRLAHNSRNFDVYCPVCAPADKNKKKLSIFVEDDRNHCWACGFKSSSLARLIKQHGSRDQYAEYISRFVPEHRKHVLTQEASSVQTKLTLPGDFKLLVLASDSDPNVLALKRYVTSRGLTERDMWYFKLGCSSEPRWKRRVIMPSFDADGELNYFTARAIDAFRKPKYDSPDVNKLPVIFNEINVDWSQRLVLCEGAFDLVKCPDNSAPLMGSDMSEKSLLFNMILTAHTPVAIALDGDMWSTKTPRLAKKLMAYDIDVVVVDTRPFGDPGSASKEEFAEALATAKRLEWSDVFVNRLNNATRSRLAVK